MSTIAAFEAEIKMQIEFLKNFKAPKSLSDSKLQKTIFCGTGDSFAAAQLGEVFSNFVAKSFDPLELLENKRVLKGNKLYLISISGNTLSNIRLAKQYRNTVAITANPSSKLGRSCETVIPLKFPNSGIQTSGSISFLASVLTCVSLVTKVSLGNYLKMYKTASMAAKIHVRGRVYILGNLHSFPVAVFSAAKLYEVLGIDAHYERIEQFSHMGLFSARRGDTIIILEKKNSYNQRLLRNLKKCGLHGIRMDPPTGDPLMQIVFFIFVAEFLALHLAKTKSKRNCYFVEAKKFRNASSAMIY